MNRASQIISNIGARLRNGLGRLSDAPVLPPTPAATISSPIPPPAVAVGGFVPYDLRASDFKALEAWRANEEIRLAEFKVPDNYELMLLGGKLLTIYIPTLLELNGQNLGAPANRAEVVTNMVSTTLDLAWSGPATYHPAVAVFAEVGGVWQQCSIVSLNKGTKTLTFVEPAAVPAAGNKIRIYYFDGRGDVALQQTRLSGSMVRSQSTLFNDALSFLHQVNQIDSEAARAFPSTFTLAQKQSLLLTVKSPQQIVWNDQAATIAQVNLAAEIRELVVRDDRKLAAAKELENRRGV